MQVITFSISYHRVCCLTVLLIVLVGAVVLCQTPDDEDEYGAFYPTHEWQVVHEGQSIPAGLHIRMNLQTGLKEAKLLDEDDSESNDVSKNTFGDPRRPNHYGHSDRRGIINKYSRPFTQEQIAEMLDKLNEEPSESSQVPLLSAATSSDSHKTASNVHHSNNHHLSSLDDHLSLHHEVKLMIEQVQTLTRVQEPSELVTALEDLEYHVHQIDNAKDLDSVGGLRILVSLLNHSNSDVAAASAHVIGSAAQSNPFVQTQLFSYGVLPSLAPLLSLSQPELLQRRAIFALSAILRHHPLAISTFFQLDGLQLLSSGAEQRSLAVLTKLVVILTDLLAMKNESDPDSLAHQLSLLGWCKHSTALLSSDKITICEKGLQLMDLLTSHCDFSIHTKRLLHLLTELDEEERDTRKLVNNIIYVANSKHKSDL